MKTLENKRIVLAVCGSIAAVETIKLAHELRRRGAEVIPVITEAACGIIHPDALTYACAVPAITKITGMVEHVLYCGEGGKADLLLIAPSTANTISKIACGIDDTIVTTFATTAIGRGMPIVLAPAMHESMYRHPIVKKNLESLPSLGIEVVPPRIEEEKAKIAGIEEICLYAEKALTKQSLAGKNVLVTSGSCREAVDSVRVMTTRSSGKMGREAALEAFRRGADVTVVSNTEQHGKIPCVKNISIVSAEDMAEAVLGQTAPDYYVSAAAVSDFAPVCSAEKIHSGKPVSIHLQPLPKLITQMSGKGTKIIGFKIGEDAVEAGKRLLAEEDVILVAANYPETMGAKTGEYILLTKGAETNVSGEKDVIAREIWDAVL
ncbi:MAG: bifunctional phosphopantothenoylcysteine decarboxylase/phosphopantothenate--cysteine ligase CoaBC [Methanocorpusculum parvum]|nr:bifunctional phosphopantothenoylcysteine decarboxylase/phosphopantothenate--cysteine ligase CoaBC [Methanocorpusculum parvum]